MKPTPHPFRNPVLGLLVFLLALSGAASQAAGLDRSNPAVQAAIAAQGRHTPYFMGKPDVVGTAVGLAPDGKPALLIFTKRPVGAGVFPDSVDGLPVQVHVSGEIFALAATPAKGKPQGGIDPTARFARPVPIGVSTGNRYECSAGTIGARVKKGAAVYALSNNHVYARENNAAIGEEVLQPGLYDTGCTYDSNNVIGTLSAFVPINFSGGDNKVDAAIAASDTEKLCNSTPINGYGTPKPTSVEAVLDPVMAVQKYGRTTALTKGVIAGINATVLVNYGASGVATFVDQLWVRSQKGPFLKAGDSGSLVVSDPGKNPVGLLFAGDSSGKNGFANRIQNVLTSFGVAVDGE